jgi:transcriptional regulator with XRE-family HTH domain
MSELGNKIRDLRGEKSQRDFAKATGLALRTLVGAEGGRRIRKRTIDQLAKVLRLPESTRIDLLHSWIKQQLDDDLRHFRIDTRTPNAAEDKASLLANIHVLLSEIPRKHQEDIYKALQRPEVLKAITPLNEFYDKMRKT